MKKRVLVSVGILLIVAAIFLMATIFQLYKEAEKVQRSIFTNEVLTAGSSVVNNIDLLVQGDTIPSAGAISLNDTASQIRYQKFAKRFILDSIRNYPVGVIQTTISYMKNDVVMQHSDTTMFDTNYMKIFSPYLLPWENNNKTTNKSRIKIEPVDSEMDSSMIQLLNKDYLYRITKEALVEQNISAPFSFAIYNAFTTQFVVSSATIDSADMLKSEFIFSLKPHERIRTPHYFIIQFDSERRIFFQRMSVISGSIIFLMLICIHTPRTLCSKEDFGH